jgi:nitric oxide reductase NorD protein
MAAIEFEPWEPEESVGKIWHAYASALDTPPAFEDAAVTLEDMRGRLGILFRGLGGARDVELKPAATQASRHRLSRRRALGRSAERIAPASFDGESLRLPERIDAFPEREANAALYLWLAACAAFAAPPAAEADPMRADIAALAAAERLTRAVLAEAPGLARIHAALMVETRALRPARDLPREEAAIEAAILHLLGAPPPGDALAARICRAARHGVGDHDPATLTEFTAPTGYRPFMPVPLWLGLRPLAAREAALPEEEDASGARPPAPEDGKTLRAKRKSADLAARRDSLILHKFESILSWAEFLNVNRRVDDDDEANARKAADDLDEIGLGRVPQKARARLRLHLDLSPAEADFERLAGEHLYPEWDHRTRTYLPDHCRVLAGEAEAASGTDGSGVLASREAQRRIRGVRRQFEALRPRRVRLTRQVDGEDIDMEAAVAARVDLAATGAHSDRVYTASRAQERDLAVAILLDASRSTESYVGGRQVIDIAREALLALAWGLDACGDETAIDAFSSLRRDRVFVRAPKRFDEPMGPAVEARIAGLTPGHYTRLGAAIRHSSFGLARRAKQRRLLLVLTDGKPNDLDHYEGRHGIEDTHMAVREARRQGQTVFGVTIDAKSQGAFARMFGAHGYVVVPEPERLITALPQLYRHLVGA